jgi:hypothetical protein
LTALAHAWDHGMAVSSQGKKGTPVWRHKRAGDARPDEPEQRSRAWEIESGTVRKDRPATDPSISLRNERPATDPRIPLEAVDVPGLDAGDQLDGKLQVLGFAPECAVALLERYVIVVWRTALTVHGVHWARKAFIHLRRSRPEGGLGLLMLAENDCDVSADSGVRSELAALITTYGERIAGVAVTYEGTGLRLTMLRGVVTAVGIASRTRVVTEVFNSVAHAATWLHTRARSGEDSVQPAHLLQAANRLRLR